MAGIILKGKVAAIGPVTKIGEKKDTDLQYMILHIDVQKDDFGEIRGRAQQWALQAIGKKVAELKMTEKALLDKTVIVKTYVDSVCLEPKEAGKEPFYAVNCTIASFEIVP
jgi:hypothetical protein